MTDEKPSSETSPDDFFDRYVKGMKELADSLPALTVPDDLKITVYRAAEAAKCSPQEQLRRMVQTAARLETQDAVVSAFKRLTDGSFPITPTLDPDHEIHRHGIGAVSPPKLFADEGCLPGRRHYDPKTPRLFTSGEQNERPETNQDAQG